MRLSHIDYIMLLMDAYKKKRTKNELSLLLVQSTPANIRRECVNVYQERYDRRDEPALRAFFGHAEQGRKFLQLIQGFETDKFKPLDNYLKGKNDRTDDKNVELLAWLIDFTHRPYVFDKNFILTEAEQAILQSGEESKADHGQEFTYSISQTKSEENSIEPVFPEQSLFEEVKEKEVNKKGSGDIPHVSLPAGAKKGSIKKAGIILFSLLISGIGIFFFGKKNGLLLGNGQTGCMYWVNDHYEKTPCNKEITSQLVLPLNEEMMKNFKKITREDTITEKSIGVLYYLKTDNKPEYFTRGGRHPVHTDRTLKKLSQHIFDTYLDKRNNSGGDSLGERSTKLVSNR